ncbi:heavy metal-associated isoprenylated plant protein 7-like [Cucurbita maxima]|uniref:Heavy metal-associated isoprenylated plant protein 7-like n=1 Tax=Cucurbita maxima TaxID=3661 RepID=A0A6J1KVV7_CUCMA|nr:heavy metal-associated isoprenylated plant protein 7-like [Cucurbita maxima]
MGEDSKAEEAPKEAQAIQQPSIQDIVLTVFMHCEGCARRVRRCLKGFDGVENVETDCVNQRVVVKMKGEKADPLKILERLERKSHRRVELISPILEPIDHPKTEDNKPQRQVSTVVLKVHMHCEACAQEIKRRIKRLKGVESVDPDLKSSQVTVKGAVDPAALVEYVHRRTGKHVAIVKQEPEITPGNNAEETVEEDAEEKKGDAGEGAESEKKVDEESKVEEKAAGDPAAEDAVKVVEVKKNEYHHFNNPQRHIMEMYSYPPTMAYPAADMAVIGHADPPQMFSDENPNGCSVM